MEASTSSTSKQVLNVTHQEMITACQKVLSENTASPEELSNVEKIQKMAQKIMELKGEKPANTLSKNLEIFENFFASKDYSGAISHADKLLRSPLHEGERLAIIQAKEKAQEYKVIDTVNVYFAKGDDDFAYKILDRFLLEHPHSQLVKEYLKNVQPKST